MKKHFLKKLLIDLIPIRRVRQKIKYKILTNQYRKDYEKIVLDNSIKFQEIKSIFETLDKIKNYRASISRFGDGELRIIINENFNIAFQKNNKELAERLLKILNSNNENILICLPKIFKKKDIKYMTDGAKNFWNQFLFDNILKLKNIISKDKIYYNSHISRPYMDFKNKNKRQISIHFNYIKEIIQNRNIIIVEGEKSRLGIGNDLFDGASSIRRILCPAINAFDRYHEILEETVKIISKDDLILIALGPTATVLSYDLALLGYQAIDIGHIDIEYEWFLQNNKEKVIIKNKYVNEVAEMFIEENFNDSKYKKEIVKKVL